MDPRFWQIATQLGLLACGLLWLDFDLSPPIVATTLAVTLGAQWAFDRLRRGPPGGRSALITGLSLCLLLRTHDPLLAAAGAALAIGSKFLVRAGGAHLFNPSNVAIVVLLLVSDRVWVSPGQWGQAALLALAVASAGGAVVVRAARADVTWTFLGAYAALLLARAAWLGDPIAIPLHRLQSGSLLVFAFFMLSDPKTTPRSRAARLIFGGAVALGTVAAQFVWFSPNGPFWSLAACSLAVPLLNRWLPGQAYSWTAPTGGASPSVPARFPRRTSTMKPIVTGGLTALLISIGAPNLAAFCGFYVAKADAKLFNKASQVVLVHDGPRTVVTMANDYRGDPKEFAMVVPVPTVLQREQIHVAERALIDHLDAYTAPRLVEYFDEDPCRVVVPRSEMMANSALTMADAVRERQDRRGVRIEAAYTVGEYDIVILSATESRGLETWLKENGYRIPDGASAVLGSYIRQGLRFFVAKVNLEEQARLGYANLRPLQVAYESPRFMLPIRLGTVNADGPQELILYTLTRKGRVETTNYRTVRLASDVEIPAFVKAKDEFGRFYRALFDEHVRRDNMSTVMLEYAWDMAWCDPCAADPFTDDELRELGVFWLPDRGPARERAVRGLAPPDVFVTRLHVRYDATRFPEDLMLQETGDRSNFQGRYVIRHAWNGSDTCEAATAYRRELGRRHEREAQALASLTGWNLNEIRARMRLVRAPAEHRGADPALPWWSRLWRRPGPAGR